MGLVMMVICFALQMGTVRAVYRSAGLRRTLLVDPVWATLGVAVEAAVVSFGVAGYLVVAGHSASAVTGVAVIAGAWAAAVRMQDADLPDFSTGLLLTEAGALPIGALLTALRGWDLCLVVGFAAALMPPTFFALTMATACFSTVRRTSPHH